jgi:hypothetical protein
VRWEFQHWEDNAVGESSSNFPLSALYIGHRGERYTGIPVFRMASIEILLLACCSGMLILVCCELNRKLTWIGWIGTESLTAYRAAILACPYALTFFVCHYRPEADFFSRHAESLHCIAILVILCYPISPSRGSIESACGCSSRSANHHPCPTTS